ncbi:MAG: phage major capsid protein [Colwellia sp.]|nr:phage major capsid protein [Colwellia sp.]
MDNEKMKNLLEKAIENYQDQVEANEKLTLQMKEVLTKYDTLKDQLNDIKNAGDSDTLIKANKKIDELVDELSDLRTQYKNPVTAISDDQQKDALREVVMKAVGSVIKNNKNNKGEVFEILKEEIDLQVKTLNITTPAEGGLAVAEVLSSDVMDYAREYSPIISLISHKAGITRDYRQMIKITFPGVDEGIEAVAGTVPAETSTQEYVEIKSHVFKLYAQPRITNEALLGTDINVYADLLSLLSEEISIYLASQLLYGDGVDKNARGMLSSNRVDITNLTGESFLPTLTPTGVGARDADFFPVLATGVDGAIGANDVAIVDFVIDMTNALPTRYLKNAVWIMNRNTKGVFEKVRDANEKPIFVKDYIPGLPGKQLVLNGHRVIIDDTFPDIASDSTFAVFGDLGKAMAMNKGDIDQMLLDPYTKKGNLIVYTEKEFFEMVQRSDAIIVAAATVNSIP